MRNSKHRLGIFLITVAMLLTLLGTTVSAAAQIDKERSTSLTIRYVVNKTPVSGIEFRLYRVADISSTGRFTAVDDFAGYSVSFDGLTSEGWTDLARTLEGYVFRDKPTPAMRGKTDGNGTISFSDCAQGLYLLIGDQYTSGQYIYTPQSLMVSLPSMNKDYGWDYDVISEPKFISYSSRMISGSGYTQQTVKKVWADDADASMRPESVTVQLLCDDSVYDERVLNESNNWHHTWSNLPKGYTWRVVEKSVPDGYTVSVSWNEYVFTVTNAIRNDDPGDPDEPPSNPGNPSDPNRPDEPSDPGSSSDPSGSEDSSGEDLPQTGVLRWPIPVMYILGASIFFAGYGYRKKAAGTSDADE